MICSSTTIMITNKIKSKYLLLECRPDCYQTWYQQGNHFREQNFCQEALFCYDKALEYYADDYYACYYRAKVLEELNDLTEALSSLMMACQIRPDNYWAWYDRGCILQDKLHNFAQSIPCFKEALKYKINDYWATYRLAKSYFKTKKYLSALFLFQKTLKIRPHDYWSYYWQGECQQALNQWHHAEQSYLQALQIKPDDYWALLQLALLQEKQCLYREAIAYYHQLEEISEEEREIYQRLSTCYKIIGNHQQAHYYQLKSQNIEFRTP